MHSNALPEWLHSELYFRDTETDRDEIEIKLVVPRQVLLETLSIVEAKQQDIAQTYTSIDIVKRFVGEILPKELGAFEEWRVRKNNEKYFVTGKSSKGSNIQRREFQDKISGERYSKIIEATEQLGEIASIGKTRHSFLVHLGDESVLVEADDFLQVAGKGVSLDYAYCELEVSSMALARSLQNRLVNHPLISVLLQGIDVSRFDEFKNANLAVNGFPSETFDGVSEWVRARIKSQFSSLLDQVPTQQLGWLDYNQAILLDETKLLLAEQDDPNQSQRQQLGALAELRFDKRDSLGRSNKPSQGGMQTDAAGFGWVRDYQTIVSSDPFLRLFSKPQIFRPGLGHSNTTTRGQHSLDVISCAQNIAARTGLNTQLAGAIAALHDVGHPAGGHVGEEILKALSADAHNGQERKFKHHVFSLSLADIFGFDLLREVQVGAFYHKSGGKKLGAPKGRPQEFGVVRIADKLSYVPWDVHDSIRNGFLDKTDIEPWIFDVLGPEPMDWIETMTAATVSESAQSFGISFSEASGDVFKAYKAARSIIYERVHPRLTWDTLRVQYRLVFDLVRSSFTDLDPLPILGYMTDAELSKLSEFSEAHPSTIVVDAEWFADQGMGFIDIVHKMREFKEAGVYQDMVYYDTVKREKIHPS